jgi:hypothetical protein
MHFERHQRGPEGRVVYLNRIIENYHHAVARVTLERSNAVTAAYRGYDVNGIQLKSESPPSTATVVPVT